MTSPPHQEFMGEDCSAGSFEAKLSSADYLGCAKNLLQSLTGWPLRLLGEPLHGS